MNNSSNSPNKLIGSHSPYLLQHAYNPVEWQPWSESAWDEAKTQNKLVLVSIGYSTCHWCHVMERESFEDFQTAEIMNMGLINIKVDREERPDIDMVYMDACQLMTGRGGWPLNVICLPDGRPIFAGTYFQKPQWEQYLLELISQYKSNPTPFVEYAEKFMHELQKMNGNSAVNAENVHFSRKEVVEMFEEYAKDIDWEHGAKNRAPKFMVPIQFEYTLDFHLLANDDISKEYLHLSLLKMANGGIFDHVRGGFYRYSTDKHWFAPHFEKMLYDNAQLLSLYARAFAWSGAEIYKERIESTLSCLLRELREPEGGFYSGLDADSDGIEGRFYTFYYAELQEALSEEELAFLTCWSGVSEQGNWEYGLNIIHALKAPLEVTSALSISGDAYFALKEKVCRKLFELQESRNRPSLDYKAICTWNALMLKALADINYYTELTHTETMNQLADWMWNTYWDGKSLKRLYAKGSVYGDGFLEDYAHFAKALLQVFRVTHDEKWLENTRMLIDAAIEQFFDEDKQTFVFVGKDSEALIIQKTDNTDDVIPSANSTLSVCLNQLFMHYAEPKYRKMAEILEAPMGQFALKYAGWYAQWSQLFLEKTMGSCHVVVHQTEISDSEIYQFRKQLPSWVVVARANDHSTLAWLKYGNMAKPGIYVCAGTMCYEPVETFQQAIEILEDLYTLTIERD